MQMLLDIFGIVIKLLLLYVKSIYYILVPPNPKDIHGEIVLVTGAGHGIGRELALEFSRRGATVVLWDINKENNVNTAKEVERIGGIAYPYTCDVSNAAEIHKTAEKVRQDVGEITILVNNAGFLNGGSLLDLKEKDIRRTFDVNILAQFWTIKEFLPSMVENNHGYVLNVASASAKSGTAFLVDYSSSKYAVYGFTEALREELDKMGKTGIQATVVCPLFVDTGFTKFPTQRFTSLLTPKETAWNAIDGMVRGEQVVYVPRSLWLIIKLEGLLPEAAVPMLKKFQRFGIEPQYKAEERKNL